MLLLFLFCFLLSLFLLSILFFYDREQALRLLFLSLLGDLVVSEVLDYFLADLNCLFAFISIQVSAQAHESRDYFVVELLPLGAS